MSVFWQRNVTFLLVTLGWVFFRAETFAHAAQWFAGLAGAHGVGVAMDAGDGGPRRRS